MVENNLQVALSHSEKKEGGNLINENKNGNLAKSKEEWNIYIFWCVDGCYSTKMLTLYNNKHGYYNI